MQGITPKQALRLGSELAGAMMNSEIGKKPIQEIIEDRKGMNDLGIVLVKAVELFLFNPAPIDSIGDWMDRNTIKLYPININYDLTIEEMIAKPRFDNDPYITSANFLRCKNKKTGIEKLELLLARPVPAEKIFSAKKVEKALDKEGFICVDLPELAALKDYTDDLLKQGVKYITALGENSRWRDPRRYVFVPSLELCPYNSGRVYLVPYNNYWLNYNWFVVRRK